MRKRMSKPESKHREVKAIVKDLWDAMLGEPSASGDRRVDVVRAQEKGRRLADRYLRELVAALDLAPEADRVAFPYFSLSYDPDGGWGAILSRFARSGEEARAQVEARAAEVSSQLEKADRDQAEEARGKRRSHAEREARASAALSRVHRAIDRIDRIQV